MLGTLFLIAMIPVAYVIGKKNISLNLNQLKSLKIDEISKKAADFIDSWIKKLLNK